MTPTNNKFICNLCNYLLSEMYMMLTYTEAKDEHTHKELRKVYENSRQMIKPRLQNITELPKEELEDLGFRLWDEEGELYLIPIWMIDLLPKGMELSDINGDKVLLDDNLDLDHRFGYLAYGLDKSNQKKRQKALRK